LPIDALAVRVVGADEVAQRVAAELLPRRAGKLEGDRRLGDNGEGLDGGGVAALDERLRRLARLVLDGLKRLLQRRQRLHGGAHDEIHRDATGLHRQTNRAGGIEAGVSNGEEIVVRAAMKPLPTLMQPLQSVDLETGEPAEALVERSDTAAVEALAVVAEASVAFELARAAREKFGGDALGDFVAAYDTYRERIDWQPR
jgi:hypothetical protein